MLSMKNLQKSGGGGGTHNHILGLQQFFQNWLSLHKFDLNNKFEVPTLMEVDLLHSTVINKNGSILTIQKIFELFPKIKIFSVESLTSSVITSDTFKKLIKIPHFSTLDYFRIFDIPKIFDIASFYDYVKINKHTKFELFFAEKISELYKDHIQIIHC